MNNVLTMNKLLMTNLWGKIQYAFSIHWGRTKIKHLVKKKIFLKRFINAKKKNHPSWGGQKLEERIKIKPPSRHTGLTCDEHYMLVMLVIRINLDKTSNQGQHGC